MSDFKRGEEREGREQELREKDRTPKVGSHPRYPKILKDTQIAELSRVAATMPVVEGGGLSGGLIVREYLSGGDCLAGERPTFTILY